MHIRESITTIVSMDSGPAPKRAHPGMTVGPHHARFFGFAFCCMYDRSTALIRRW
jgi:hypothetical protein